MVIEKYPHLSTQKSRNHIAKPTFKNEHQPCQQKGRVPLHLEKIQNELENLINDKEISLKNCLNDLFVSAVVITVKMTNLSNWP